MLNTVSKSIFLFVFFMSIFVTLASSAAATDNVETYDTVELKNGEKVTGTVLNSTFTIVTPYSNVALEKDDISEIQIDFEPAGHDVVMLNSGGLMEGTIEEPAISFALDSGKTVTLEKKKCKKIIFHKN